MARRDLGKLHAFMKPHFLFFLSWTVIAALPAASFAEKADRNVSMNIEADALRYDDLNQTSVFTGNVLLTKGSMKIRGQRLEVRQDSQGHQFARVTGSVDAPAFFRQKRDGLDEFMEGEAQVLEYDGKTDTVKLTQKARIQRYRGAVLADEITGAVIVYDNTTDRFNVDGSISRSNGGAMTGRVRVMQTPRSEAAASSSSAQVVPALRATSRLKSPPP